MCTYCKGFVVAGAIEHDLLAEYIESIRSVEAARDLSEVPRVGHKYTLYPEYVSNGVISKRVKT